MESGSTIPSSPSTRSFCKPATETVHLDHVDEYSRCMHVSTERFIDMQKVDKNTNKTWKDYIECHLTFHRLHICYFLFLACIGTVGLWLSPKPKLKSLSFVDALYTAVSTITLTGLVSVNPQDWPLPDQMFILLLSILGSQIFTSLLPVYMKLLTFHYSHDRINFIQDDSGKTMNSMDVFAIGEHTELNGVISSRTNSYEGEIRKETKVLRQPCEMCKIMIPPCFHQWRRSDELKDDMNDDKRLKTRFKSGENLGLLPDGSRAAVGRWSVIITWLKQRLKLRCSKACMKRTTDLLESHEVGKGDSILQLNSSSQSMEHLEHNALVELIFLVSVYAVLIQTVGFLVIESYLFSNSHSLIALKTRNVDLSFFAFVSSCAAFSNSGLVFINDNMVPFRESAPLLLCIGMLILVGNTMFAPCMRAIIWLLHRKSAEAKKKAVYDYLLKHPRKCYTHLFPYDQTIWLVVTVMGFTAVQAFFFFLLERNSISLQGLATVNKLVVGIFQSITTRNAGENVVNLRDLSAPMLVLYIGMMYIAAYPLYLSRQNTRTTIEQSDPVPDENGNLDKKRDVDEQNTRIYVHARKLLARDSAYLFMAIFMICILENRQISKDPLNYSILNIFFEVISAYGNVGFSVGYSCNLQLDAAKTSSACTDVPYSFSGKWRKIGKLMLVTVMFYGRQRVLPDNMDYAVTFFRKSTPEHHITEQNVSFSGMEHPLTSTPVSQQSPSAIRLDNFSTQMSTSSITREAEISTETEIDDCRTN